MFWKRKPRLKAPPPGTSVEMHEATAAAIRDRIRKLQSEADEQGRLSGDHQRVSKERYSQAERYRELAAGHATQQRGILQQVSILGEMLAKMHE